MKRSNHVDRWLHGEENRANQEKPICSSDQRSEKEERTAYDKAQRGAEVDSGTDDLVSPVDLEVPWGQVIESRIQQLHVRALPGDRESKPPRPHGLSTANEVQVTDSSPEQLCARARVRDECDRAGSGQQISRGRFRSSVTLPIEPNSTIRTVAPPGGLSGCGRRRTRPPTSPRTG